MSAIARVTATDPEATALLVEYPMLGDALLRHLKTKEREHRLTPQTVITLSARHEPLFFDQRSCRAAWFFFDVTIVSVAGTTILRTYDSALQRWWKRYMPPTEHLGIVSILGRRLPSTENFSPLNTTERKAQ